jgi:hypothetical protein
VVLAGLEGRAGGRGGGRALHTGPWSLHQAASCTGHRRCCGVVGPAARPPRPLAPAAAVARLCCRSHPGRRLPFAAGSPSRALARPCTPIAAFAPPSSRRTLPRAGPHRQPPTPPPGRSCCPPWCCRVPTSARPLASGVGRWPSAVASARSAPLVYLLLLSSVLSARRAASSAGARAWWSRACRCTPRSGHALLRAHSAHFSIHTR